MHTTTMLPFDTLTSVKNNPSIVPKAVLLTEEKEHVLVTVVVTVMELVAVAEKSWCELSMHKIIRKIFADKSRIKICPKSFPS